MYRFNHPIRTAVAALALAVLVLAPVASADQQILDDLIVDGSICAGQDCVNGESFGFDTIRLKENNLRVKFQDTSTSASFPSNDWELTANDSSNGGLNHFSITDISGGRTPFRVEAGARTNALYVEADGDIGIGTNNPVADLHVKTGNTPTLRLDQDGSSGFTAQIWDLAGNEANFFIRDATNGSTLPFRIFPSAPSDALVIEGGTGHVGVGTNSPSAGNAASDLLEVKGSTSASVAIDGGSNNLAHYAELILEENNVAEWSVGLASDDNRFYIYNYPTDRTDISIDSTTGVVTMAQGAFIQNGLTVTGGCGGCDAVFQPDWPLESIEEHAEAMFANSYLPGVGPTGEGEVAIDVFEKTTGILQELEKAHIYIAQLNDTVKQLRQENGQLEELNRRLAELEAKLAVSD